MNSQPFKHRSNSPPLSVCFSCALSLSLSVYAFSSIGCPTFGRSNHSPLSSPMLATQLFWQTQPVIAPPPLTGFQPAHHLCFLTSLAPLNLKVSPLLNGFIYQGGKEEILLVYVLMIVHCRMQPHLFIFVPMPFQLAINRIPIKEWVDS